MKVLIAEDSMVDRVLLERILAKAGYEPVSTGSSEEALEAYSKDRDIGVALLDWMLPSTGGLALIREIRTQEMSAGRYCIIFMVTAKAKREDIVRAIEAGADDFISKPVDETVLATKLRAALRLANGVRAARGAD